MNAARVADRGWLSEHALRSGLTEQFATDVGGVKVVVELKWVRHHDNFLVTVDAGTSRIRAASFASLDEARAHFTRRVQKARSTLEGEQP